VVLAHRGGTGPWRENTLEAFSGALAEGADGVELDVRSTADGRLVVHHDADIRGVGAIPVLGSSELPPWVPSLEEALEACAGAVVNVEVKNAPGEPGFDPGQAVARRVAEVLAPGTGPSSRPRAVVVSSFWPATVAAVREGGPGLCVGLLVHPALEADPALETAAALGCRALHLHYSQVSDTVVGRARELDMAVVTWTVNDRSDVEAATEAGVDALITDQVRSTLAALGRV